MEDDKIENGLGEQPMPTGYVEPTVESVCSEIMAELMNDAQSTINSLNYKINRLKSIYEKTGREDIKNCIEEIKENQLADAMKNWETYKGWFEYFSGIPGADESGDDEDDADGDDDDSGE